jgi:hypothetical protein
MKTLTMGAALVAALLLIVSPTVAQSKKAADCAQPSASPGTSAGTPPAPEKISGTVTDIDGKHNMVTLRSESGETMQFRGDRDTVKDLKVGDKIDLNRRAAAKNGC